MFLAHESFSNFLKVNVYSNCYYRENKTQNNSNCETIRYYSSNYETILTYEIILFLI